MPAARLGTRTLDGYREEADRFIAALDEEYYLHFAGLKDEFEVGQIYERYAELTSLEACEWLRASVESGLDVTELWRFACEGYLGDLTRAEAERIAHIEATTSAVVDGEPIPYRMLRPAIANEPDRARRERLERARNELSDEHLAPRHESVAQTRREGTRDLGFPSYKELYERFGFRLDALASQCRTFLSETEDLYVFALDRLFRDRIGLRLEDAERWDLPRLFRATNWDPGFPAGEMMPALVGTLADLGIDLLAQRNVEIDLEPRPSKSPRAFCTPIEIPGRVILVIKPIGGPEDWRALFHEAGHTEHYAHTSPDLPMEARRLGDVAVTEGWAMLFELLVNDGAWLTRRLDFGRPDEFATEGAIVLLYLLRRYCGKFLYELELHGGTEADGMPARYAEWMREATKISPWPGDFLADVDPGFYSSSYLRSWAFEAQLRQFLREEFGTAWFARREAGSLLRELWSEGQRLTADELLDDVTGAEIELGAVFDRIREDLRISL